MNIDSKIISIEYRLVCVRVQVSMCLCGCALLRIFFIYSYRYIITCLIADLECSLKQTMHDEESISS